MREGAKIDLATGEIISRNGRALGNVEQLGIKHELESKILSKGLGSAVAKVEKRNRNYYRLLSGRFIGGVPLPVLLLGAGLVLSGTRVAEASPCERKKVASEEGFGWAAVGLAMTRVPKAGLLGLLPLMMGVAEILGNVLGFEFGRHEGEIREAGLNAAEQAGYIFNVDLRPDPFAC